MEHLVIGFKGIVEMFKHNSTDYDYQKAMQELEYEDKMAEIESRIESLIRKLRGYNNEQG
jgi:hypothetical protein